MGFFRHEMEAPLVLHGVGKARVIWYHVLFMPSELARRLPWKDHPRLRVRGEIVDVPVAGAWLPSGDGRHYFIVSPVVRKATAARLGDVMDMRFDIDDQDRVDVPPALAAALSTRPEARAAWERLSPGQQRRHAHPIGAAKTEATIRRRVQVVVEALTTPTWTGPSGRG